VRVEAGTSLYPGGRMDLPCFANRYALLGAVLAVTINLLVIGSAVESPAGVG